MALRFFASTIAALQSRSRRLRSRRAKVSGLVNTVSLAKALPPEPQIHLPNELWIEILQNLDSTDLFSCLLVCSHWRGLVNDKFEWHTLDLSPWAQRWPNEIDNLNVNGGQMRRFRAVDLKDRSTTQGRKTAAIQGRMSTAIRIHLDSRSKWGRIDRPAVPCTMFWTMFSICSGIYGMTGNCLLKCPKLKVIRVTLDFADRRDSHDAHCLRVIWTVIWNFTNIAPNLTELDLSDSILRSFRNLVGFSYLPTCCNLRILRLNHARAVVEDEISSQDNFESIWTWIESCSKLEILSLADFAFGDPDLKFIETLYRLKELDLHRERLTTDQDFEARNITLLLNHYVSKFSHMIECSEPDHPGCKGWSSYWRYYEDCKPSSQQSQEYVNAHQLQKLRVNLRGYSDCNPSISASTWILIKPAFGSIEFDFDTLEARAWLDEIETSPMNGMIIQCHPM